MVIFKEIYHFSRFQYFSGGVNFSQVGSNRLFPIETHITHDFPGGPDPLSSLWIRTWVIGVLTFHFTKELERKDQSDEIFRKPIEYH